MLSTALVISLLALAELPVDVAKLDGERLTGTLQSLSTQEVVIVIDGEQHAIAVSELQELRPDAEGQDPVTAAATSSISVTLRDGSQLLPGEFTITARDATMTARLLGELQVPKSSVAHVRFSKGDQKLTEAWQSLLEEEHRDDLVVVRKGEALDHVDGVVGAVTPESVELLLDGQSIPIPRNRVFGVIYANSSPRAVKPLCSFELTDGQQLAAVSAQLDGETFAVEMAAGGKLQFPSNAVKRIDFSLGKIRSLADLEPTAVKYPADLLPQLERVWKFRRGQNSRGEPLLLGGQMYDDGLWIHSGTTLRYRLGREYRRFRGLMGIDEDIGNCSPQVGVIIRGDGRVLVDERLTRKDAPRELDLDVEGVRELEIEVVSNDPDGICEHLDLVEARLIK